MVEVVTGVGLVVGEVDLVEEAEIEVVEEEETEGEEEDLVAGVDINCERNSIVFYQTWNDLTPTVFNNFTFFAELSLCLLRHNI